LSKLHSSYIRRCLQLARKGLGTTTPNPMVGALIVKNGKVVAEGFHLRKGEAHAEVNAIENADTDISGATLYCSLEPCCHTKKSTPPCTDLIIKSGISKVIVATLDPNPQVAGKGLQILKEHGVEVSSGYCVEDATELNKVFFKSVQSTLPYIHLKVAITLDGRIATSGGDSRWISSQASRSLVHDYRNQYDSVMIGRNTLNLDNPKLTARRGEKTIKTPAAVVIGNPLHFKKDSFLLQNLDNLFVINTGACDDLPVAKGNSYELKSNAELEDSMKWLKTREIQSVLVEGGSKVISSLIEQDLYDELTLFICPKVIGNGESFFNSSRRELMGEAMALNGIAEQLVGGDIIYKVRKNVYRAS